MQDRAKSLISSTPIEWVETVLEDFDRFLQDHAACERKAAALAMSFVAKYSDRPMIIEPMVSLAREELHHFRQVFLQMQKRGLQLASHDDKDPYVNGILKRLNHGHNERFLDRLIASGLIESRGHERFSLLAQHLSDPDLKLFYDQLAKVRRGIIRSLFVWRNVTSLIQR